MSASSSSDCDLQYSNYRTYTPIQPLYPELGHPLIYYAQVQKKKRIQQNGKGKNNCFVKAFQWYTQERVPLKKIQSGTNNEDMQGFAAWLDQKYEEYIRKNVITQIASSQYLLKQTSTVKSNKLAQSTAFEKSVPRKKMMKSPWRRRQKYINTQNGDTIDKSDQSIEIILNPKSLSRSTSECCQKCHRSNNAIVNTPKILKSKSESIIYILNEKEMYVVADDNDTITDKKNQKDDTINEKKEIKIDTPPVKDISCQCSILELDKVDASNQFSHTKTSNLCDCVESYSKVANQRMNYFNAYCFCNELQSGIHQRVEEPNALLSTVRPSVVPQKSEPNNHSAIASQETSFFANTNIDKNEPSFSVNGIAQTSDQAINLYNVINPEHPIFFKIICADE